MKSKILILFTLLIAISCLARLTASFSNWNRLVTQSPSIMIARCGDPVKLPPGEYYGNLMNPPVNIKTVFFLKGTNSSNAEILMTDHSLLSGYLYLVIGYYDSGTYRAFEDYRVIPLGRNFDTKTISGKPLNEQLQILFQHRINDVKQQIQAEEISNSAMWVR